MKILNDCFSAKTKKLERRYHDENKDSGTHDEFTEKLKQENNQKLLNKYKQMYQIEKTAINNLYRSKMSSLMNLKEQNLQQLSQRLENLKRQREIMIRDRESYLSQNELLKPKAASSRPSRHFTSKNILAIKVNPLPVTPSQTKLIRPKTPGTSLIYHPNVLNGSYYFH